MLATKRSLSRLQKAVIHRLGYRSLSKNCIATLEDVVNHGADGGFGGFTYYAETASFFKRNRGLILKLLRDTAEAYGESISTLVQSFRCLRGFSEDEINAVLYEGKVKSNDDYVIANCFAWFALEEVARQLVEEDY